MAKQFQTVDVNTFVKGLITEAGPLTYPEGASLDEDNFVLNRDGSRSRRLGMAEEVATPYSTTAQFSNKASFTNIFEWDSPAGLSALSFLVVQSGESVLIFDRLAANISTSLLHSFTPDSYLEGSRYSFTSVDGILVVATGGSDLISVVYDTTTGFTEDTYRVKVRDLWGVDDGLTEGMDITFRPFAVSITPPKGYIKERHIYNLRNQTWATTRLAASSEETKDPIFSFLGFSTVDLFGQRYPSNCDTVNQALYANPQDGQDALSKRLYARDLFVNPPGTVYAPRGYFLLDVFNRGASRKEELEELESTAQSADQDYLVVNKDLIPEDRTSGGVSVTAEYAGRAWYGGFSGELIGGDKRSPRLSSYVFFSQLVRSEAGLGSCYAEADPTSPETSDPVATDGGFIRIDGAKEIKHMEVIGTKLLVFADNGVWSVEGGSDFGFSATDYLVTKITNKGLINAGSVVYTGSSVLYWSESGIFVTGQGELGNVTSTSITNTTIQSFYDDISYEDKGNAVGVFDDYTNKVRWVFSGNRELILDLNLSSFSTSTIYGTKEVRGAFTIPPYASGSVTENITVSGEQVTVIGEDVVITYKSRASGVREVKYAVATQNGDLTDLTFATYSDVDFLDYGTTDAAAYLITGYVTQGDFQRNKSVPYLTLHFKKTEVGFDENFEPVGASGCLVRVAWEWANSTNSNRWGNQFQGYRFRRHYIPADASDEFDNGFETVVTKNKLRGKGRALSLHFNTEAGKDCVILGWSYVIGVSGNV